jgi:UvrB/uvrC motif
MQHHLHDAVARLNRLKRLYDFTIFYLSPRRITQLRKLYQDMLVEIEGSHEIRDFDFKIYKEFFRTDDALESTVRNKTEAIKRQQYELAASYRDKERKIIRAHLQTIGVNPTDTFFIRGGIVYRIK